MIVPGVVHRGEAERRPRAWRDRVAFGSLLFVGVLMICAALHAFAAGEVTVLARNHPAYIVYRNGPTSSEFALQVGLRAILGACAGLGGACGLWRLLCAPRDERARFIEDLERARTLRRETRRMPAWLASFVICGVVFFFVVVVLRAA